MSIIHLTGNPVVIGNRVIQRCLLCGYKLIDMDLDRIDVPEGDDTNVPTFEVGHFVEVTKGNPTQYLDIGRTERPIFEKARPYSCIHLVEV